MMQSRGVRDTETIPHEICLSPQALQQTEQYCRAQGLPFPRVEPSLQEQRQPAQCHLFSDLDCPEAPVVLHFPLVNAAGEAVLPRPFLYFPHTP